MIIDKIKSKQGIVTDKLNILEKFTGDKYLFCQGSLDQAVLTDRMRSNFSGSYYEKINITSIQSYIVDQVNIYWPLIGEGVKPNTLSRLACIFLLNKIIGDRRYFDGYFQGLNSNNINIANQVYGAMIEASMKSIPHDAIAHRISRFKMSKSNRHIFDDMKNVIVEYRSIMDRLGLYDLPSLIERYYKDLVENPSYKPLIDKRDFVYLEDLFGADQKDLDFGKNMAKINDLHYDSYYDMYLGLINTLEDLINQDKVSPDRIAIIVPNKRLIPVDEADRIGQILGHGLSYISGSETITRTRTGNLVFSALAIHRDLEFILSQDDKLELLRVFNPDKTYIYLARNIDKLMVDIRRDLSVDIYGQVPDQEFAKKFFKEYLMKDGVDDHDMVLVSSFCDHLKDLNTLIEACDKVDFISISDEARLGFLKEYSSIFPGNMTKMELASRDNILVMTLDEYKFLANDRDYLLVFDADSKAYIRRVESNLDTDLAYMEDSLLTNIDDTNLDQIYSDLEVDKNKTYMKDLWSTREFLGEGSLEDLNIYLLHSDLAINGYDQLGDRRLLWT
ncbi:hypothetical protein [Peptostreptococcus stomatis]